jgi:hypothetical protein
MVANGTEGQFLAGLTNGDSFGELAVLGMEKYRLISVVAQTYCEMSTLTREDLMDSFSNYPDAISMMKKLALEKSIDLNQKKINMKRKLSGIIKLTKMNSKLDKGAVNFLMSQAPTDDGSGEKKKLETIHAKEGDEDASPARKMSRKMSRGKKLSLVAVAKPLLLLHKQRKNSKMVYASPPKSPNLTSIIKKGEIREQIERRKSKMAEQAKEIELAKAHPPSEVAWKSPEVGARSEVSKPEKEVPSVPQKEEPSTAITPAAVVVPTQKDIPSASTATQVQNDAVSVVKFHLKDTTAVPERMTPATVVPTQKEDSSTSAAMQVQSDAVSTISTSKIESTPKDAVGARSEVSKSGRDDLKELGARIKKAQSLIRCSEREKEVSPSTSVMKPIPGGTSGSSKNFGAMAAIKTKRNEEGDASDSDESDFLDTFLETCEKSSFEQHKAVENMRLLRRQVRILREQIKGLGTDPCV